MTENDKERVKAFCEENFPMTPIGTHSAMVSNSTDEWWGYTNGLLPHQVLLCLSNPPSEWGLKGTPSSYKGHMIPCSGADVKYLFMLWNGTHAQAENYLDGETRKNADKEPFSQKHHDACLTVLKKIQSQLLDVNEMLKRDKDSEING